MFDDFKDSQFVAYSLIKNSIKNDRLSHAYLIDANGYEQAFDFVMAMVKMIICENHFTGCSDYCDGCNLCSRIDHFNYSEIKIIESDSLVIKKEQLLELQSEFSRSSIEGPYRIYIIRDCDKMNKQASNCLLKFLEEPVSGIIAILVTNHVSQLLSTIVSRCQLIRLSKHILLGQESALENFALVCSDNHNEFVNFLGDETKSLLINDVLSFIRYYEENGLDILIVMRKMWYNKITSREDTILAFLLLIYLYYDVLKYKISLNNYFFCNCLSDISFIAGKNSIERVIHKIEVLNYGYEMLQYNLNINLLMDDVMIKLGDKDEYCRS